MGRVSGPEPLAHRLYWGGPEVAASCARGNCKLTSRQRQHRERPGDGAAETFPTQRSSGRGPLYVTGRRANSHRSGSRGSTTCPRPGLPGPGAQTKQSTTANQRAPAGGQLPTVQPGRAGPLVLQVLAGSAVIELGRSHREQASWSAVRRFWSTDPAWLPAGCHWASLSQRFRRRIVQVSSAQGLPEGRAPAARPPGLNWRPTRDQ